MIFFTSEHDIVIIISWIATDTKQYGEKLVTP
jgi:hypothetical protein